MGTGTAVSPGDLIQAAKMNLKLETVNNGDIPNNEIQAAKLAGVTQHQFVRRTAGDVTTTSTSYVILTDYQITMTTTGGAVLVVFNANATNSSNTSEDFALFVDGTPPTTGIVMARRLRVPASDEFTMSFTRLITGLSAGSHTFTICWKVLAGTGTVRCGGAGPLGADAVAEFSVTEFKK
jgi:hypothetical protein